MRGLIVWGFVAFIASLATFFIAGFRAGRIAECNDHLRYVRSFISAKGHVVDVCR